MKKFAILADLSKPKVQKAVDDFIEWSKEKIYITDCFRCSQDLAACTERTFDYLIVFGGDGFILSAARKLNGDAIAVVGVNFGKLGFLTEVTIHELQTSVLNITIDKYQIKKCMMLQCDIIRKGTIINSTLCLNDGVIKSATSRMIFVK